MSPARAPSRPGPTRRCPPAAPGLPPRDRGRERGSASVWVAGCAALVLTVAFAVVVGSSAVLARHRAENAADLAALAGAREIGLGGDPCGWAAKVAQANGASVARCAAALSPDGRSGSVTVAVARPVSFPLLGSKTATAVSKATRQP